MDGVDGTTLRVVVGGLRRPELMRSLERTGVRLNEHARALLASPVFAAPTAERVDVAVRSVASLGLADGARLGQILAAASAHGLAVCPAATGPFLRIGLPAQGSAPDSVMSAGRAPSGSTTVATEHLGRPGGDAPAGSISGPWTACRGCGATAAATTTPGPPATSSRSAWSEPPGRSAHHAR